MALRLFDDMRLEKAKEAELGRRVERLSLAVERTESILAALELSCEEESSG